MISRALVTTSKQKTVINLTHVLPFPMLHVPAHVPQQDADGLEQPKKK